MEISERLKEGQIQLLVEYGSQHGQLHVNILEVNNVILPAVKRLGISHVYVKSHLLTDKTKELLKSKGTVIGYFLPNATREFKRKTEEVKLTLSCHGGDDEDEGKNSKPQKSKLRAALKKQRERFRLKRNSDKVKTMVNAASGDDTGRATLTFERPLYYPSVSLYQLQTQFLHLTVCGRNFTTTRSYPIATACIPLMIAIKQHHPTCYSLSYNPDFNSPEKLPAENGKTVHDSWDKHEGNYTGRSLAWDMSGGKESNQDTWLHKRKDYSRHLQPKGSLRQPGAKAQSKQSLQKAASKNSQEQLHHTPYDSRPHDHVKNDDSHGHPRQQNARTCRRINRHDSGVDMNHVGSRHDSIEELYFTEDDETSEFDSAVLANQHANVYTGGLTKQQKTQWTSEFVICAPSKLDSKRTSHGSNLDMSSLSLHRSSMKQKTFSERIRGF